jgi:hypothetical protein
MACPLQHGLVGCGQSFETESEMKILGLLLFIATVLFFRWIVFRLMRSKDAEGVFPYHDPKRDRMEPFPLYPENDPFRVASHEAGHALAAWGSKFVSTVPLVVVGEHVGGLLRARSSKRHAAMLWDELIILLAGPCSEALLCGDFKIAYATQDLERAAKAAAEIEAQERLAGMATNPSWASDQTIHVDIAELVPGVVSSSRQKQILRVAFRHALHAVDCDRPMIFRIAKELRDRRRLTERDLEKLIGPRRKDIVGSLPPGPLPSHS